MKKLLVGVAVALAATAAWASCQTNMVTIDGRLLMCTTCCYGGQCFTNCF